MNEESPEEMRPPMEADSFPKETTRPDSPLNLKLEVFEGPLDLLLHLIRKNEIDIYDIPINAIARQYLEYLEMMKNLNLDIAGEFLLMAATLLHIKSRMLLPPREGDPEEENVEDNGEDPREELVRRLLEYQRLKEAALELAKGPLLDREVFIRKFFEENLTREGEEEFAGEVTLFDLLEAMKKVLQGLPADEFHEISVDHLKITDKISQIMESLWTRGNVTFLELYTPAASRREVVLTFLALLELLRLRMIKVYQSDPFGAIRIFSPIEPEEGRKRIEERIP